METELERSTSALGETSRREFPREANEADAPGENAATEHPDERRAADGSEEVRDVLRRAEQALSAMTPEDREETSGLLERARGHLAAGRIEEAFAAAQELSDMLFYVEESV